MSPTERSDIDFNIVLDRIIEFSEKNLSMQNEFLNKIYELRNRFDSTDRDHRDLNQDTKNILQGINNIYDKMKATPNEQLLHSLDELLEKIGGVHGDIKTVLTTRPTCEAYHKDCASLEKKVDLMTKDMSLMSDSYTFIKNIATAFGVILIAIQIIAGVYLNITKQNNVKNIVNEVMKEIHEQDTNSSK